MVHHKFVAFDTIRNKEVEVRIVDQEHFSDGVNWLMGKVFEILGHGDGENNGRGSLWNCAPEIYTTILNGDKYYYADYKFYWEIVEDKPKPKRKYVVGYSAVVDTGILVEAVDDDEAIQLARLKIGEFKQELRSSVDKCPNWDYDGNIQFEHASLDE